MNFIRLSKNVIIYGLSNGLQSLVPFIMLPILTSYISAEGYGLLSLIDTSILFLAPFVLLNIDSGIAVEFYKIDKKELSIYITNGIFISITSFVIILILFITLNNVISDLFSIPITLVLFLPFFVILRLIPAIVLVLYQAQQEATKYLSFNALQTVSDFTFSTIFVMCFKYGYLGRLGGIYFALFLFSILGIIILFKRGYIDFTISKQKINEILKFGIPLIPHVIGGTTIIMSGRYFISLFKGNESVGLYAAAYQMAAIVLLFSRSVNQAWSPMLFNLLKYRDFKSAFRITIMLGLLFILIGLIVYLSSGFLFNILLDKSYHESREYFPFLLLGILFQSIYFLFTNFYFYLKKTVLLAIITFSGAMINLILNYFFIKSFGVTGIAYSSAITWFLFLLCIFLVFKFKIYYYVFETN